MQEIFLQGHTEHWWRWSDSVGTWCTLQVFAFLLIAASAAGTASAVTEFWDSQAAAAVAMSYVVFVFVTLSAILSAHRLFHLFKGSNSSSI